MSDNKREVKPQQRTNITSNTNPKTVKKKKMTSGQKTLFLVLKLLAIPVVGFILFMVGMATGYKYGGGAPGEVFEASTWRSIFFIIFG